MKKIGFLILMVLVLLGCDDDDEPETCSTPATVRNLTGLDGCGWVFELSDGTRLEPVQGLPRCGFGDLQQALDEDPLADFEYVDGKRVLIGYEPVNSGSFCMVGPTVKITCISEDIGPVLFD